MPSPSESFFFRVCKRCVVKQRRDWTIIHQLEGPRAGRKQRPRWAVPRRMVAVLLAHDLCVSPGLVVTSHGKIKCLFTPEGVFYLQVGQKGLPSHQNQPLG